MRRIALFVLTNLLIILVASVVFSLLGAFFPGLRDIFGVYSEGINYPGLFIFCLLFGMGGSFLSLFLSKTIAKASMRVQLIDPQRPATTTERELVAMVRELADEAKLKMPEVGIFPAAQPNAFATGWNKNAALVAVSQGMLRQFQKHEVRAVMAHEVGHIANGDMVTLTLIQGVVNTFVIFAARVVAFFVDRVVFRREGGGIGIGYFMTVILFEMIFAIFASMVVCAFSRWREFRADKYAAQATSATAMIDALKRLQSVYDQPSEVTDSLVAFGIKGKRGGFLSLLSTHPPLEKRIAALQELQN